MASISLSPTFRGSTFRGALPVTRCLRSSEGPRPALHLKWYSEHRKHAQEPVAKQPPASLVEKSPIGLTITRVVTKDPSQSQTPGVWTVRRVTVLNEPARPRGPRIVRAFVAAHPLPEQLATEARGEGRALVSDEPGVSRSPGTPTADSPGPRPLIRRTSRRPAYEGGVAQAKAKQKEQPGRLHDGPSPRTTAHPGARTAQSTSPLQTSSRPALPASSSPASSQPTRGARSYHSASASSLPEREEAPERAERPTTRSAPRSRPVLETSPYDADGAGNVNVREMSRDSNFQLAAEEARAAFGRGASASREKVSSPQAAPSTLPPTLQHLMRSHPSSPVILTTSTTPSSTFAPAHFRGLTLSSLTTLSVPDETGPHHPHPLLTFNLAASSPTYTALTSSPSHPFAIHLLTSSRKAASLSRLFSSTTGGGHSKLLATARMPGLTIEVRHDGVPVVADRPSASPRAAATSPDHAISPRQPEPAAREEAIKAHLSCRVLSDKQLRVGGKVILVAEVVGVSVPSSVVGANEGVDSRGRLRGHRPSLVYVHGGHSHVGGDIVEDR